MEWLNVISGPVLGIATSIITVQIWAIKTAKQSGVREERARVVQEELDAAHKKIREVIMPKVEALEREVSEISIRAEGRDAAVTEMKQDLKTVLSTMQGLLVAFEGLKVSNGNGNGH